MNRLEVLKLFEVDQYPYLNITKEQKKLLADFCYNGYKNLYG